MLSLGRPRFNATADQLNNIPLCVFALFKIPKAKVRPFFLRQLVQGVQLQPLRGVSGVKGKTRENIHYFPTVPLDKSSVLKWTEQTFQDSPVD